MCVNVPHKTAGQNVRWHKWHVGTRPILNLRKERRINNSLDTRARGVPRAASKGNATMKRITIIALALALMLCAGCVTKITAVQGEQPTAKYDSAFLQVRDVDEPQGAVRIAQEIEAREAERAAAEAAAEAAAIEQEYAEYWEAGYYEPTYSYSGDGFMQEGVRAGVDSDTETWYSSNAAYHYRTNEWTPDDEGYYRDADGYYVVASDDYPEGSVVTTSKGEAKVYDSGTDSGNIDMYVNW